MLCSEAKIALKTFLLGLGIFWSIEFGNIYLNCISLTENAMTISSATAVLCFVVGLLYRGYNFQIGVRAALLGAVFALGFYVRIIAPPNVKVFGTYMCIMAFFHFSEFFFIALIQPKQVSTDSFVINHSPQYIIAAVTSWLEFFLECYFFPGLKQIYWLSNVGLSICVLGELLRKASMLTARSNFHHLVQCEKSNDHILVTHGVYAWFRHPSYVGWFYWSIGTQIVLLNPLCVPAYAIASWHFFKTRIYIEEITLLNFFGQSYCDYQQKVSTGLPFIKGYKI
nr:unnamed protein product [Callosobruchus analis]